MSAAVTAVGSTVTTGNGADIVLTSAVPAGALLAFTGAANVNITTATPSGPGGNPYSSLITLSSGTPVCVAYMAYSFIGTPLEAGSTVHIGFDKSVSKQAHVAVMVTGLDAVAEKFIRASGSSASPSPGATGLLSSQPQLQLMAIGATKLTTDTLTAAGWSKIAQANSASGTNDRDASMWARTVSATASSTPSASLSPASTWGAVLLSAPITANAPAGPAYSYWDGANEKTGAALSYWDGATEKPIASSEFN